MSRRKGCRKNTTWIIHQAVCGIVGPVQIPYRCHWCTYLGFCCLHSTACRRWLHRASFQRSVRWVGGSAAHRGWLGVELQRKDKVALRVNICFTLKCRWCSSLFVRFDWLTSVDNCLPLVELALVRHGVKVTALRVPEAGQVLKARAGVTDLVPPSFSQTVLPSVLRAVRRSEMLFQCCSLAFKLKTKNWWKREELTCIIR